MEKIISITHGGYEDHTSIFTVPIVKINVSQCVEHQCKVYTSHLGVIKFLGGKSQLNAHCFSSL